MSDFYSAAALKKNAWSFLSGKFISASLTLILMLVLVRALPVQAYGAYIALLAIMDLLLGFCDFGMHGLGARYLPEFILRASRSSIVRLVRTQLVLYTLFVLLGAVLMLVFFPLLGGWFGLTDYTKELEVFLVVIVVEGVARLIKDQSMGILMRQDISRMALLIRLSLLLSVVLYLWSDNQLSLYTLVVSEALASLVSLGYLCVKLVSVLAKKTVLPQSEHWQEPSWSIMWRSGLNMYFSSSISLFYGSAMFALLLQRGGGLEIVALFGFSRTVAEYVFKYLPVNLLYGVVQPHLVAVQVNQGGSGLATYIRFARKLNLFVLLPILACSLLFGGLMMRMISGGRFDDGFVLAGMLLVLFPLSSRRLMETVAMVLDKSSYCVHASLFGLIGVPIFLILSNSGFGVWAAILSLLFSQVVYNQWIGFVVANHGRFSLDAASLVKMLAPLMCVGLLAVFIPVINGAIAVISVCLLIVFFFLLFWYFFKPFDDNERLMVNNFIGRRVFVW